MPEEYKLGDIEEYTADEAKFVAFLTSRYGFFGMLSIRGKYTFRDITKSPEWAEWVRIGKPATVSEVEELGRYSEAAVAKPTDRDTGVMFGPKVPGGFRQPEEPWAPSPEETRRLGMLDVEMFDWQRAEATRKARTQDLWRRSQEATDWARYETERQDEQAFMQAQAEQTRANRATQRMSTLLGQGPPSGMRNEQVEQMAKLFNQWKQQYIGTLDPDLDWIKIDKLTRAPNLFQPEVTNLSDELGFVQEEKKRIDQIVKSTEGMKKEAASDPYRAWTSAEEDALQLAKTAQQSLEGRLVKTQTDWIQTEAKYAVSKPTEIGGEMVEPAFPGAVGGGRGFSYNPAREAQRQRGVLTPEWLAKATGQERGQPLQKGEFTPSPQWLRQTDPATRARMAGWQEWSQPGAYTESIRRMETMLPRQPVKPRWRTPAQRI